MSLAFPSPHKDFVYEEITGLYDSYKHHYEATVSSLDAIDYEHLARQAATLKELADRILTRYKETDNKTAAFCQELLKDLDSISLSKKDAADIREAKSILRYVHKLQRYCEETAELEGEKEALAIDARLIYGQFNAYFNSRRTPPDLNELRKRLDECVVDSDMGLKPLLHFAKSIFGVTCLEDHQAWISSIGITICTKATTVLQSIHRPVQHAFNIRKSLEESIKLRLAADTAASSL